MRRVKIHVFGRVHGVMFRAATQEVAEAFDLAGFVRNENDGSVLIDAQGTGEQLSRFIEWCRKGPPSAKVERVECEWIRQIEPRSKFVIEYD